MILTRLITALPRLAGVLARRGVTIPAVIIKNPDQASLGRIINMRKGLSGWVPSGSWGVTLTRILKLIAPGVAIGVIMDWCFRSAGQAPNGFFPEGTPQDLVEWIETGKDKPPYVPSSSDIVISHDKQTTGTGYSESSIHECIDAIRSVSRKLGISKSQVFDLILEMRTLIHYSRNHELFRLVRKLEVR